ncbi:MAG TPA: ABC transporter permease [Phototrophicaceae bacterium]|jgi:peptide/nickel transport system permease protein|nr:ABC transporter permease [Phototrophicaceae bacterium]
MATTQTNESSNLPVKLLTDESYKSRSLRQRSLSRFLRHRMAVTGGVMLLLIFAYVTFGAFLYTEAQANFNDTSRRLQAPSVEFPFGTDTIGRNIMARTIYGGQISLLIGIFAVIVETSVGVTIGLVSGYYGGWIDAILMRVTEAMLSIPQLLILLVVAKFMGTKIPTIQLLGRTFSGSVIIIIVIIGLTSWMGLARIVRSGVLSIKESEYIVAARALGAPNRRIIFSHIIPNTLAPVLVAATLGVANAITTEAYISFLGFGVQAPTATWGNMLEGSRQYIEGAPWLWIFPGLMILLTVMGINFVGDGLRDAFDPRSDSKI